MEEKNKLSLTIESEYARVVRLRKETQALIERKKRLTEEFEKENSSLFEELIHFKELLSNAEENLKTLAINEYNETGEKNLYGGVKVKEMKSLEYDTKKALQWATEHKMCLSLDKSAFKKVMNAHNENKPEWVIENINPLATIPREMEDKI